MTLLLIALFAFAVFATGSCQFCRLFTEEKDGPEIGFVDDVEHDSEGNPLTGWRKRASQLAEMVFNPLCAPINRLLGR